jgi:hypothetical protein
MLNGILNYYSFAKNKPQLLKIYWIFRKSLAKTIAIKLKLKTARQVYIKFGINIEYPITKSNGEEVILDFKCPPLKVNTKDFRGVDLRDPFALIKWTLRTKNAFNEVCANCGTPDDIQMHHVKHIKTVNEKLDAFGHGGDKS